MTLRRAEGAALPGIVTWRGKAEDGEARTVQVKGHPLERLQPWLASEVAVAPTKDRGDFRIDWNNLAPGAGLVPAGGIVYTTIVYRTPTLGARQRLRVAVSHVDAADEPATTDLARPGDRN